MLCFCFVIVLFFLNSAGLNIVSPLKLDNTLPLRYNLKIFAFSKIFSFITLCVSGVCVSVCYGTSVDVRGQLTWGQLSPLTK